MLVVLLINPENATSLKNIKVLQLVPESTTVKYYDIQVVKIILCKRLFAKLRRVTTLIVCKIRPTLRLRYMINVESIEYTCAQCILVCGIETAI